MKKKHPSKARGTVANCIDRLVMLDEDGQEVGDGDSVFFSYGIPPCGVSAPIKEFDGTLWALTPDHTPKRCELKDLREYVGSFYKA